MEKEFNEERKCSICGYLERDHPSNSAHKFTAEKESSLSEKRKQLRKKYPMNMLLAVDECDKQDKQAVKRLVKELKVNGYDMTLIKIIIKKIFGKELVE